MGAVFEVFVEEPGVFGLVCGSMLVGRGDAHGGVHDCLKRTDPGNIPMHE